MLKMAESNTIFASAALVTVHIMNFIVTKKPETMVNVKYTGQWASVTDSTDK